jgi:hypothetical protein
MTHEERMRLYKAAGKMATEYFKMQYPYIDRICIFESHPYNVGDVEFYCPVKLIVFTDYDYVDFYSISNFLRDWFNIRIDSRHLVKEEFEKAFKFFP